MDSDRARQEEHGRHQQYSTSELMSSAKVVAEAAQSALGKESGSLDKTKVADAAGDLLGGARQYGNLEDKGMGQYVEKAENYLHQYSGGGHGQTEKPSESKPEEGRSESGGSGGGIGDYMKMAQGFMNK
ncbi:nodulin-related protein 1-like [Prosopis cineraria]|uniref:nodulin-related protein 1-like n=1 Tax=Prosopis cineraria TaxID=364024 RepID=UPI00240F11E1|nr:nodulin-related protein 1-like [Prosopis cineraria]XP_054808857.1 nodulin-related protein 1-like [Prosopis cineraria]